MAAASAETLPLFRSESPAATAVYAPRSGARPTWDADAVPDQSYWTAYDHYMVEREARAMRRAYVGTLLAKAWSALRRNQTT